MQLWYNGGMKEIDITYKALIECVKPLGQMQKDLKEIKKNLARMEEGLIKFLNKLQIKPR